MKTSQVNLRLEPELVRRLEQAAVAEHLERGSMLRKLLIEGLDGWQLEHSLRLYQRGEITIGRACEDTGRSHWEMLDLVKARGITSQFDAAESLRRIRPMLKRYRELVAEPQAAYPAPAPVPAGQGPREPGRGGSGPNDTAITADDTLPDLAPRPGGVLVVGINPATRSVDRGHYYQGRLGKRLWARLERLGLLSNPIPGEEDAAFVAKGHGLTDLVKRATASADALDPDELRAGREALLEKVRKWKPALVLFPFKMAASFALGRRDLAPGRCGELAAVPAFLLTGPYAKSSDARRLDAELRAMLDDLLGRQGSTMC
jgi:TDG/mug DNA glycosylase family protein